MSLFSEYLHLIEVPNEDSAIAGVWEEENESMSIWFRMPTSQETDTCLCKGESCEGHCTTYNMLQLVTGDDEEEVTVAVNDISLLVIANGLVNTGEWPVQRCIIIFLQSHLLRYSIGCLLHQ